MSYVTVPEALRNAISESKKTASDQERNFAFHSFEELVSKAGF